MTTRQDDPALEALTTLASATALGASELEALEDDLSTMRKRRCHGWSWQRIVASSDLPKTMSTISGIAATIGRANGRFRRALVKGLQDEGTNITSIAGLLQVSRQRISNLVHTHDPL